MSKGWEKTALREIKDVAEEEICLAKESVDVSKDGTPGGADGIWAKWIVTNKVHTVLFQLSISLKVKILN